MINQKLLAIYLLVTAWGCVRPFDLVKPCVVSVDPAYRRDEVPPDTRVKLTFNKVMEQHETEAAFSLTGNNEKIDGRFEWKEKTVIFKPDDTLKIGHQYRVRLETSACDSFRNHLETVYISRFQVGKDATPPRIKRVTPADGSVHADLRQWSVTFSETMNTASAVGEISISPAVPFHLDWSSNRRELVVRLMDGLESGHIYTLTLSGEFRDKAGNRLGKERSFACRHGELSPRPELRGVYAAGTVTDPFEDRFLAEGAVVPATEGLAFAFDRPMNRDSVESALSIEPSISGRFHWQTGPAPYEIAVFTPDEPFFPGRQYHLRLDTSVTGAEGQPLAEDISIRLRADPADAFAVVSAAETMATPSQALTTGNSVSTIQSVDDGGEYRINLTLVFSKAADPVTVQQRLSWSKVSGDGGTAAITHYQWSGDDTLHCRIGPFSTGTQTYLLRLEGGDSGMRAEDGCRLVDSLDYAVQVETP